MPLLTTSVDVDFTPDPKADKPIYLQLTDALANSIRVGDIEIGEYLPSERRYAHKLGISRTTVATVLSH